MNKRTIAKHEREKAENAREAVAIKIKDQIIDLDKFVVERLDSFRETIRFVRAGGFTPPLREPFDADLKDFVDAIYLLAAKKAELAALKAPKPAPAAE